MSLQTRQQQIPWIQTRGIVPLHINYSHRRNKSFFITFPPLFHHFLLFLPCNLCLESQESYSVKAVCSAHYWHSYRSSARQQWIVPVLRQKYSFSSFTIYIAAIIWSFSSGWRAHTHKKKTWGGRRWRNFTQLLCELVMRPEWHWSLSVTETSACVIPQPSFSKLQCSVTRQFSIDFLGSPVYNAKLLEF